MAYIKKEPIVEFITKGLNNPDQTKAYGYDAIEILAEIEYSPTADVVEVVRCKDCEHWLKDVAGCTDFVGRCEYANYMVGANGYCVYGEKALKEREKK